MDKKDALTYTLKFAVAIILSVFVILLTENAFNGILKRREEEKSLRTALPLKNAPVLVIDAGHGGEDGGAIANDGTTEKEINLKIAKTLYDICALNKTEVKLTRENDTLLYDAYGDKSDYKGVKKIYDLKNRVKLTEENENPVYVGIHMNKFGQSKYKGLQVYYSKNNEKSSLLASSVQDGVAKYIQPWNTRKTKPADSSIFILNTLKCPSILVECGFLSNDEELSLLKSYEYQKELSLVIFASCLSFTEIDN